MRIVFGDDRSQAADVGWLWIGEQRWPGWQLDVVTIPETALGPFPPGGSTALEPWTPEDPRQPLAGAELAEVRHLTAHADPRVVLGGCDDADLIVVGATGQGFLKRRLRLGSTTEWLLHQPPAPLLIARSGRRVRRVLVGVDGSDPATRAVEAFARLPWAAETEVVLLAAADGDVEPGPALDAAGAVLQQAGIAHRAEAAEGRPAEALLQAQEREDSQLVVLGTRGRSGLRGAIAGSTASSVARAAETNVLLTA